MIPEHNKEAPHTSVIWITAKTYELLPTGECSGRYVDSRDKIIKISGANMDEAIEKLDIFLRRISDEQSKV